MPAATSSSARPIIRVGMPHACGIPTLMMGRALEDAPQRAPGFVEGLAVLARDDGRDLIEPLVQDVLEPEQMTRAHYRGDGAPGGERCPGGGDRLIYITRRRQGYPTQRLGGGGVGEFEAVARGGLDPLAADMIAQCPHGAHRDNPLEPSSDACEGLSIGRWCNIK